MKRIAFGSLDGHSIEAAPKTSPRTSETHPLQVEKLSPGKGMGRALFCPCPGRVDYRAMSGAWERDLDADLDRVRESGATAVVSLIEPFEFERLKVEELPRKVRDRSMEWWNAPIPDGHPPGPEFEEVWDRIGEALRDRLQLGFDVLIHCRGGLGRAGTIAARLLVELGADPEEAIRRVREKRPHAIENDAQEDHVRACVRRRRVTPPASPSRTEAAVRDRALGAFLGLAVGDAVGGTLEFTARDTEPRLADMIGGGPHRLAPGQWTDDTAMALALGESLVDRESLDGRDLMDRFTGWWRRGEYSCTGICFDIGNTVRAALARYEETGDPMAGVTDPRNAGNGSLMRLAPVVLRFSEDREALLAAAAEQSRTTHGAEEAVDACRAFAALLADATCGMPRAEVLAPRDFAGAPKIAEILAGSWRGKPRDEIRSSGYVVDTLEATLWSVARTADFRSAILLAANLGEDADTVAAVTGQLAGALYGMSGIPEDWLGKLAWKDRLLAAGEALRSAAIR